MSEEPKTSPVDTAEQPAAKPKKEKPPALEEKPFAEFIQQDYIPALSKAFKSQGIESVDLKFVNQPIRVKGLEQGEPCWQLEGHWGQKRQFNLYFIDGSIQGQRAFSCTSTPKSPVTLESFLIDERKITLDLLVLGLIQRLNGQKWLSRN